MSDRDEGYCYWMGEPINAMTREAAIEALGKAIVRIAEKNFEIDELKVKLKKRLQEYIYERNVAHSRFTNESYINSFC